MDSFSWNTFAICFFFIIFTAAGCAIALVGILQWKKKYVRTSGMVIKKEDCRWYFYSHCMHYLVMSSAFIFLPAMLFLSYFSLIENQLLNKISGVFVIVWVSIILLLYTAIHTAWVGTTLYKIYNKIWDFKKHKQDILIPLIKLAMLLGAVCLWIFLLVFNNKY